MAFYASTLQRFNPVNVPHHYMQDEVVFPAFGIDCKSFWRRCTDLVREGGYESELAYMKVLLDTLDMDRPTNAERKNGGEAIAVCDPDDIERIGFRKCYQLSTHADRVKHIAPSDYRRNTHLRMLLEQTVQEIANRMVAERRSAIETGTVRAPEH